MVIGDQYRCPTMSLNKPAHRVVERHRDSLGSFSHSLACFLLQWHFVCHPMFIANWRIVKAVEARQHLAKLGDVLIESLCVARIVACFIVNECVVERYVKVLAKNPSAARRTADSFVACTESTLTSYDDWSPRCTNTTHTVAPRPSSIAVACLHAYLAAHAFPAAISLARSSTRFSSSGSSVVFARFASLICVLLEFLRLYLESNTTTAISNTNELDYHSVARIQERGTR